MRIENHTETPLSCLGGGGRGQGALPGQWTNSRQTSASFSTNKAKNPSSLTVGEGERGGSVSADFSRSKQAVPGNSSKQNLGSQVGLGGEGPSPAWTGAWARRQLTQVLGVGGERRAGKRPLGNIRISGQGPGSKSFLTVMAISPSCSEVSSALLFPNTHQPRKGPRFSTAAPGEEREEGWKGVAFQVHTQSRTRTVLLLPLENVPELHPIPYGPVPELWPRSPWALHSQETPGWGSPLNCEDPVSREAPPWSQPEKGKLHSHQALAGSPSCLLASQQPRPHPQPPQEAGPPPGLRPVRPTSQRPDPAHALNPSKPSFPSSFPLPDSEYCSARGASLSGPQPSPPSAPSGVHPEVTFSGSPQPHQKELLQEGVSVCFALRRTSAPGRPWCAPGTK